MSALLSALAGLCLASLTPEPALRVATFNIETFPKSQRQIEGAFDILKSLSPAAVGVQEIVSPERFLQEAQERLGASWRFVHAAGTRDRLKVGVLYDGAILSFRSVRIHPLASGRPALEVRLARSSGEVLRLIVVHLKAGGDSVEVRRRQLRSMRPILRNAVRSGEQVVVLGDFNTTGAEDREHLSALVRATGLVWASRNLACTSYWARRDGCLATPLDHALTWRPPRRIAARGPCERVGCDRREQCPVFHREVSDHCPVTMELP